MLYLFPNHLGAPAGSPVVKASAAESLFSPAMCAAVAQIDGLIAESEKAGRRFLDAFETKLPSREIPLALFEKKPNRETMEFLLEPVLKGETWGVVSDAGLPCLADPGSQLVALAHRKKVAVRTFPGPCSITQALVLSGLPGQRFTFHGYLSREPAVELKMLQERTRKERATQIFMEAPYRNMQVLTAALENLDEKTLLSVSWSLTLPDEGTLTAPIHLWRKWRDNDTLPDLARRPAVFLLYT